MPLLERSIALLEKSYVPHDAVSAGQFANALNTLGTAQLEYRRIRQGYLDASTESIRKRISVWERVNQSRGSVELSCRSIS